MQTVPSPLAAAATLHADDDADDMEEDGEDMDDMVEADSEEEVLACFQRGMPNDDWH